MEDKLRINMEIKYWVLFAFLILTGFCLWLYYYKADSVDVITILGIAGANVALATLIYTAMNLHSAIKYNSLALNNSKEQHAALIDLTIGNHNSLLDLEKKKHSSELISKWQTPEMVQIVTKGYEVRNKVDNMDGKQIAEFLSNNTGHHQALVCIFNYFEKMATLIEYQVVNEPMLKAYFKDLINVYYHCFSSFVEHKQREMNSEDVMSKFLKLAKKWQAI